jgi:two-component system, sensor histidine kinase and response regulator
MPENEISDILSGWEDEFITTLIRSQSLCVALFSTTGDLVFANDSMSSLFKNEPSKSLINPTFETLLSADNSSPLVFEGFLTLGDYTSINTSIWAQVYRKDARLLIMGGVNAATLQEQNETMHQLNREITSIQRDLIKEKYSLQKTLGQLNEANDQLKKLNADKDRFIGILGHDLKNPFHNILGLAGILAEDVERLSNSEMAEIGATINRSAKGLYKLLEDILLWARAQQGKIPFNPQYHNFSKISSEVYEVLKPNARAKNIAVKDISPDDLVIFADIDMVKTVLRNLVSNAIKFTNSGGLINVKALHTDSIVTITVSDNGVGITPEIRSKLFDISEVVTTKGTGNEKGTGLGLLLCKEFVEQHGGKIWVESEVGKGSDFIFTLPAGHEADRSLNKE